jgi:hypothetical protein
MVFSDEAVAEVDARLNSPEHYISIEGGLTQSTGNDVTDWVLKNFTGF